MKKSQTNKKKRNTILLSSVIGICILCVPASFLGVGFSSFHPYQDTYYAALSKLANHLKEQKDEKKIIVLGTSSVAFGVNGELLEKELNLAGLSYKVIPFGLYGSLGTKLMMELSRDYIQKEDIVLFAPEFTSQTLSTFFSGKETFRAFDTDPSLFHSLDIEDKKKMILSYSSFASDKYGYLKKKEYAKGSGVYAASSFNSNGDLVYPRAGNSMPGYSDENNPVDLTERLIEEAFASYVQEFAKEVRNKGASIYFHFSPTNKACLSSETDAVVLEASQYLTSSFEMPLLGNPHDSFMEKEYFYDTNFHLNDAGMNHYTLQLSSEIKSLFNNTTPNQTELMDKPELPKEVIQGDDFDNTDADCFTYAKTQSGYILTGVTKEGREKENLVIPGVYQGSPVEEIDVDALKQLPNTKKITIQSNIRILKNSMFDGCDKLKKIHIRQKDPTKTAVGFQLFTNERKTIVVPKGTLTTYLANYSWSYYSDVLMEEE